MPKSFILVSLQSFVPKFLRFRRHPNNSVHVSKPIEDLTNLSYDSTSKYNDSPPLALSSVSTSISNQSRWADDLPVDILLIILECLSPTANFLRFGCVCRLWRSVAVKQNYPPLRQLPWLMLSEHDPKSNLRCFFSPSEDKIYELTLPEVSKMQSCGSTDGWLCMLSIKEEMFLQNPMSRVRIPLPPLWKFKKTARSGHNWAPNLKFLLFVRKMSLSCHPSKDGSDCITIGIYSSDLKLAFARPGDKAWTTIKSNKYPFLDVIFYRGHFYAVNYKGCVVRCDIQSRSPKAKMWAAPRKDDLRWYPYLVESSGDLLQVIRSCNPLYGTTYKTTQFKIFRLDISCGEWVEVKSLGDQSLFLGCNTSMSVLASDVAGCQSNCIYFTDDKLDEGVIPPPDEGTIDDVRVGHDMGVYSLEDGSIKPHYPGNSSSPHSPPLWVTPNLW